MWLAEIFHRLELEGDSSKTVCQVIDAARDTLANYTHSEDSVCEDGVSHVNSGVFWRVLIIDSSIILGMVVYGFVIWVFGKQITLGLYYVYNYLTFLNCILIYVYLGFFLNVKSDPIGVDTMSTRWPIEEAFPRFPYLIDTITEYALMSSSQ